MASQITYPLDAPVDKTAVRTICSFTIFSIDLVPFTGCKVSVRLLDADGRFLFNAVYDMNQQDYALWTNDDDYIISWIKDQIINWTIPY